MWHDTSSKSNNKQKLSEGKGFLPLLPHFSTLAHNAEKHQIRMLSRKKKETTTTIQSCCRKTFSIRQLQIFSLLC